MAWVLEVLVDATLVAFVVSLRKMAIAASTSRRGRPVAARRVVTDSAAPRRQQTTAERQQQRRWEYARADVGGYDEQVTVHYGEPEPATAQYAQPQYAQPQYAEPQYRPAAFEEPVVAREREFEADPRTAVFDQTAFAPFEEPVVATAADGFFDQDAYNEPQPEPVVEAPVAEQVMPEPEPERPAAGFIETGVVRGRRDAAAPQRVSTRKKPAPKPAPQRTAPAAASPPVVEAPIEPVSPVGGSPWEPVPVPRPTYTMKPPAPPRRRRYDAEEPLLPPVEPVPELDAADELEEILDRRWAVND
jgi:hypothetical protein